MTTNLNSELEEIKARNLRVEADKAWEVSWSRRLFIAIFTYFVAFFYMSFVGLGNPLLGAFVPSGGYIVSTISLPFMKNFWLNNIYKKREQNA